MTDRLEEIEALYAKAYAPKRNQEPVPTVGESLELLQHIPWLCSEVRRLDSEVRARGLEIKWLRSCPSCKGTGITRVVTRAGNMCRICYGSGNRGL